MAIRIGGRNETNLTSLFSWLTRNRIGPKFGSRPIGWYQSHQVCALEAIQKAAGSGPQETIEAVVKRGQVLVRRSGERRFRDVGSTTDFARRADACSRR